jgi:hypothetical protein
MEAILESKGHVEIQVLGVTVALSAKLVIKERKVRF